jgi:hypothetical protein
LEPLRRLSIFFCIASNSSSVGSELALLPPYLDSRDERKEVTWFFLLLWRSDMIANRSASGSFLDLQKIKHNIKIFMGNLLKYEKKTYPRILTSPSFLKGWWAVLFQIFVLPISGKLWFSSLPLQKLKKNVMEANKPCGLSFPFLS